MHRGLTFAPVGTGAFMTGAAGPQIDARDRQLALLMARSQDGDKSAYGSLLRESEPVIRRIVSRTGLIGDLIEDAVQDTLLTLHQARHTYDPSRSFMAWLTVLAQRRAIDTLRRAGRVGRREVHAPVAYEQHEDDAADPSRSWDARKKSSTLQAAIASLTASQREAVEHLALREQSLPEAAAETGKSVGALKVNLHRALKALRAKLAGGEDV